MASDQAFLPWAFVPACPPLASDQAFPVAAFLPSASDLTSPAEACQAAGSVGRLLALFALKVVTDLLPAAETEAVGELVVAEARQAVGEPEDFAL